MRELDRPIGYFERFRTFLRSFLRSEDTGLIRIFGKRENKPLQIIQVPLRIGALLEERLWQTIPSIIATSATLQVADSFTYIDRVLSLENFQKHVLETDFDYAKQALLYLPSNLGDVRKDDQKRAIEGFISDIIEIYHGRILMLFTSFSAIRDMTLAVSPLCKKEKIRLLTQGMSGGKHKMVSEFMKHSDHSVLFGTESFWE